MVHLRTLETTSNRHKRKEFKLALIKRLYEQGLDRQDIINLYALIDWMMTLSKELEREFQQELKQYEEGKKMPYITSMERSGELKGELKGKQAVVIKLLNQRFGEIEPPLVQKIRELPGEQLEQLTDVWLTLANVTDLERWLQDRPKLVEPE